MKRFKNDLIKVIPMTPNDINTKNELESESISSVLLYYINWAARLIKPKPRQVIYDKILENNPNWIKYKNEIQALINKVEKGEDLYPHLSLRVASKGYTAKSRIEETDNCWEDKDFILNVMGFHHFHLDNTNVINNGFLGRTNHVIFAKVQKDTFEIIGIFDHQVFESDTTSDQLNIERQKMWDLCDKHSSIPLANNPNGMIVMNRPITLSGNSVSTIRMVQNYMHVVKEIDPKIDTDEYVNLLYKEVSLPKPKKHKLKWAMNYMDLGLVDSSKNFFLFRHGDEIYNLL